MNEHTKRGWYYGWTVVAVCIVAGIAASALPINAFSLFLASWSKELGVPVSTLQIGIGGCGVGCALLSPLIGSFADRYPAKRLFVIGLGGMAVFCFGISYVTAVWQYIALYAVLLPISLLMTTSILANAVVSRWFVRRLGLALSLTSFGLGLAGIVMPPIVAATLPTVGWRGLWRIGAVVIAVIVLPLVALALRERPSAVDGRYYLTGNAAALSPHGSHGTSALRWRDILARRNFWLLVIVYVPMLALYGGVGQNIAPLAASRGLTTQTAGVLLSLLNFSQLGATLLAGMLSDRFGNRIPFSGLAFAAAIGGVCVVFGGGSLALWFGIILAGCGGAFWPLIATTAAAEFGPSAVGRVFGMVTFFLPFTVSAPFAVAKSQEMTGSYTPALLVITGLTVLGAVLFLTLLREQRPGTSATGGRAAPSSTADSLI